MQDDDAVENMIDHLAGRALGAIHAGLNDVMTRKIHPGTDADKVCCEIMVRSLERGLALATEADSFQGLINAILEDDAPFSVLVERLRHNRQTQ